MLIIRSQAEFEQEYKDKDIAKLHYEHQKKMRHKILLKLANNLGGRQR
jgi:hypothetical protein